MQRESSEPANSARCFWRRRKEIQGLATDFLLFSVKHHRKYPVGGKIKAFYTRRHTLYLSSLVTLIQYVWISFNIKMKNIGRSCVRQRMKCLLRLWLWSQWSDCLAATRMQAALSPASHAYCFVTVTVAASFLSSEILVQGPGGVIASARPFVHICHRQDLSCLLRLQGPCGLKSLDIMILWRKSLRDQHK